MMRSSFVLASLATSAVAKAPHLVYILIDDMGFNDFYSSTDIGDAWPNVQKLAKEQCVKVEHYYTQPICTPTRGAFMSGRYPARLGLQHGIIQGQQNYGLPLHEVTLADKLRAAGYNTIGVGKWHLGMYNNASTPTRRGFNHYFGYYTGGENYYTHEADGYLDLHDDEAIIFDYNGTYSMTMFQHRATLRIQEHVASKSSNMPMFLYLPFQNVHQPLQALDRDTGAEPCASITDEQRQHFCGMAMAADRAIGSIWGTLDQLLPNDDTVVVISGDNGGYPGAAGNNCPQYGNGGLCLRGTKSQLYEGGVRNNALLCSKTMVPETMKGQTYSKGLVHVTDWHATLRDLAGASDQGAKATDGMNVFDAITGNTDSPRKEFLLNIDPCSGRDSCEGEESAYRFTGCVGDACGDWKYFHAVSAGGWFPPVTQYKCSGQSGCEAPSAFSETGTPSPYELSAADLGEQLYDLSVDPSEERNVASTYPAVVTELKARVAAIKEGDDYLAPCNVPDGSCSTDDPRAAAVFAEHGNAWFPWAQDPASSVAVV